MWDSNEGEKVYGLNVYTEYRCVEFALNPQHEASLDSEYKY